MWKSIKHRRYKWNVGFPSYRSWIGGRAKNLGHNSANTGEHKWNIDAVNDMIHMEIRVLDVWKDGWWKQRVYINGLVCLFWCETINCGVVQMVKCNTFRWSGHRERIGEVRSQRGCKRVDWMLYVWETWWGKVIGKGGLRMRVECMARNKCFCHGHPLERIPPKNVVKSVSVDWITL